MSYFDQVIEQYTSRRNVLVSGLESISGVKVAVPNGAFYCMAQLPIEDADHFAQWLLESFEYENQTIMVAPAAGFYSTKGLGSDQIRIAYVLNERDLKESVLILEKALDQYRVEFPERYKINQAV